MTSDQFDISWNKAGGRQRNSGEVVAVTSWHITSRILERRFHIRKHRTLGTASGCKARASVSSEQKCRKLCLPSRKYECDPFLQGAVDQLPAEGRTALDESWFQLRDPLDTVI